MAKIITYQFMTQINKGTEAAPDIETILRQKSILCANQSVYDGNYPMAESEAVPGTIQVTGEFEQEILAPTPLDILEAQVTYTAMMTDTLLEV